MLRTSPPPDMFHSDSVSVRQVGVTPPLIMENGEIPREAHANEHTEKDDFAASNKPKESTGDCDLVTKDTEVSEDKVKGSEFETKQTYDGVRLTQTNGFSERTECLSPQQNNQSIEIETKGSSSVENNMPVNVEKDKGWAWVIAVVALLNMFISVGSYRYLALLLVELKDIYEESTTQFALILTWNGIGFSGCAVLYILGIGEFFHERALMAVSGVICALGFTSAYLSTKLEHVYILGFCTGVSAQFGPIAALSLLGEYFDKRLALANGIAMSGVSLGTLALPPFVQILFDEYGYRGASLILAGVSLNTFACAGLMRPVKKTVLGTNKPSFPDDLPVSEKDRNVKNNEFKEVKTLARSSCCTDITKNAELVSKSISSTSNRSILASGRYCKTTGNDDCAEGNCQNALSRRSGEVIMSFNNKSFVGELEAGMDHFNRSNKKNSIHRESRQRMRRTTLLQLVGNFFLKPRPVNLRLSLKWKSMLSGLAYFKDPAFIFFQVFAVLATLASECLVQFVPALAVDLGTSQSEAGYLLSIIGAGDLICRIASGFCGDYIDRVIVVVIPQFILGIACFLSQFAAQFWSQIIFSTVIGLTYGVNYAFETVILIDYFGLPGLSRTLGVTNLLSGIGFTAGGPVVGRFRDLTGNYILSVQFLGSCFFISGLCMMGVNLSRRFCKAK